MKHQRPKYNIKLLVHIIYHYTYVITIEKLPLVTSKDVIGFIVICDPDRYLRIKIQ